jgi:hypothetical protein
MLASVNKAAGFTEVCTTKHLDVLTDPQVRSCCLGAMFLIGVGVM